MGQHRLRHGTGFSGRVWLQPYVPAVTKRLSRKMWWWSTLTCLSAISFPMILDSFFINSVIHDDRDGSKWASVWLMSVHSTVPGSLKTCPHHVTCKNVYLEITRNSSTSDSHFVVCLSLVWCTNICSMFSLQYWLMMYKQILWSACLIVEIL